MMLQNPALRSLTFHSCGWPMGQVFNCTLLVLFLIATLPAAAQLPAPELTSVYPPGAKQGSSVDVTLAGKDLDDVSLLQFTHAGITATQKVSVSDGILPPEPIDNQFSVVVAGDVPPGIYEVRVVGRFGVSNPRAFQVGNTDELMDDGSNKTIDKAKTIPIGAVINGRVDASSRDYYRVTLKQGQQILVSCAAQQLDSRMDATLVIYDGSQREIARDRDSVGTDPLIDFTAPADGDYIIGVYDFVYGGGGDYFYRLSVHARPHVDFVFPPVGLPGSNATYTLYGRNLPGGKPAENIALDQVPLQQLNVNISLPDDAAATQSLAVATVMPPQTACLDATLYQFQSPQGAADPVTIYFAAAPIVLEQEPNNDPQSAQQITTPCEFVGQFYPERDFDWVQFEAKKNDVYWIDLISHRMGLESDPVLHLQKVTKDDKGDESVTTVATVDDPSDRNARIGSDFDTSTDDPSYRFSVKVDGTYRILVRDQFGDARRDPRCVYRLVIRPEQPDFRLSVRPMPKRVANANIVPLTSAVVRKGGNSLLHVQVDRRDGFDGEINVAIQGLPTGVAGYGAVIDGKTSNATLVLSAADDAAAWTGPIQVVGTAKIGDEEVSRTARAGSAVWGTSNRTQIKPTFRLTQDLTLAVVDKETAIAQVQVGEDKVWETSRGGKLEIPLKVTRRDGFKADLKLTPADVPNEFKPKDVTIKGDAAEGKLEVAIANANTKPGIYTFYLKSDAKFKYTPNPDAVKSAEVKQKEITARLNELTERQKEANDKKTESEKAAGDAATALKEADARLAAAKTAAEKDQQNQQLVEAVASAEQEREQADAKNNDAATARIDADKALADADTMLKKAQALKKTIDTNLANVKKANAAKDVTITLVSTPIKLRIHNSPIKIKTQPIEAPLKQGEKLEAPVSIERLFGFTDQVELTLEAPQGVSGISVKKLTLPKDSIDVKFELAANDKATVGEHSFTIRAKAKFNNVNVEATQQLTIRVEEVEK